MRYATVPSTSLSSPGTSPSSRSVEGDSGNPRSVGMPDRRESTELLRRTGGCGLPGAGAPGTFAEEAAAPPATTPLAGPLATPPATLLIAPVPSRHSAKPSADMSGR